MKLAFTVPGHVQAKERHRTAALKRCMDCRRTVIGWPCKYCGGKTLEFVANVSTPGKKSETYESFVALCAREAGAAGGGTEPVRLTAQFYFAIPKSRARKLAEGAPHTQRPDLDNCLKSIKDGLNQVAWHDDCCVVEINACKRWTHQEPRAEIMVESLEDAASRKDCGLEPESTVVGKGEHENTAPVSSSNMVVELTGLPRTPTLQEATDTELRMLYRLAKKIAETA